MPRLRWEREPALALGTVIEAGAVVGEQCTIGSNVTIYGSAVIWGLCADTGGGGDWDRWALGMRVEDGGACAVSAAGDGW